MSEPILQVRDLNKFFQTSKGTLHARNFTTYCLQHLRSNSEVIS